MYRRAGVQVLLLGVVLASVVATTRVAEGQALGRPARQAIGNGTVSLDVYAHGAVLDLLTTTREGARLELRHRRSTDGGETWGAEHPIDTSKQPISIATRGNEPQVVSHADHVTVHWSTTGTSRFGAGPMVSAVSHDAGRTWKLGPRPTNNTDDVAQNFADMTADPDGVFYVAWIGSHDGPAGRALGLARSTDFGETWGHSQLVDTSSCACCLEQDGRSSVRGRPGSVSRSRYPRYGAGVDRRRWRALVARRDGRSVRLGVPRLSACWWWDRSG